MVKMIFDIWPDDGSCSIRLKTRSIFLINMEHVIVLVFVASLLSFSTETNFAFIKLIATLLELRFFNFLINPSLFCLQSVIQIIMTSYLQLTCKHELITLLHPPAFCKIQMLFCIYLPPLPSA